MKGIFKALSMVILLAALIGAGVLVKKNQETRKGAALADSSSSILPSSVSAEPGSSFSTFVWVNTGKSTDMLQGAEVSVSFDASKLNLTGFEPQSGYSVLDENLAFDSINKIGKFNFASVALGTEKGGAVSLAKLTFKAVGSGSGSVVITSSKIMVNGQSASWDVIKNSSSSISISGAQPTVIVGASCSWCGTSCVVSKPDMMCTKIAPPAGKSCVNIDNKCTIVDTNGNKSCSSDANCGTNGYCYQPPMPACPEGKMCPQVMPAPYCKTCTPRLACMDANPACMPDMAPGSPPFCPPTKKVAQEGQMCGGIAGIMCATGLRCDYSTKVGPMDTGARNVMPDRSGICVRDSIKCEWCGTGCRAATPEGGVCPMIAPPGDKSCVSVGGKCTIVPNTSPTPAITCNWCGDSCIDSRLKIACKMTAPPAGKSCQNVNGRCTIVPNVTPSPGVCGQRCTQNQQCQGGMTCAPIWWPCGPMPATAMNKVQTDQGLTQTEVNEMIRICPTVKGVMPSGYEKMGTVRMPSFYGVCRNPKCISSTNCSCVITPTPTANLSNSVGTYSMQFSSEKVRVGEDVWLNLAAEATDSTNKISATKVKIKYFSENFDVIDIQPEGRGTELMKEIDKTAGTITLYYTWNLPADRLFNRYTVANIKLKPKKEGTFMITFDRTYSNEMSGIDGNGKSISYKLNMNDPKDLVVSTISCGCAGGQPKKTGDANCDGLVNSVDFEIWRNEMFDQGGLFGTVKSSWQSDYNCDQKVSGVDFEIWRKTVFQ